MKKIAIIGSGIAGLTCAYHLSRYYEITVYEAADYIGGHTHTVQVEKNGEQAAIDTGFIVFNDRTYPHFMRLLDELQVAYQPTEMSFSVRNDDLGLEYNGNNLNSLFAQRRNLVSPRFLRMLREILRFNREVRKVKTTSGATTLGEYLSKEGYSDLFRNNYILPMVSAIWSMGMQQVNEFPLQFFTAFFDNHGLLDVTNRPQWYTIIGGSSSYIKPLTHNFHNRIRCNAPVTSVEREDNGVTLTVNGSQVHFDEVVFACHGDQALRLLAAPTEAEQKILSAFVCSENRVVLHTDTSLLPRKRLAWASWNYLLADEAQSTTTLTYNMNILQRLQTRHTYLVTLNQRIAPEHTLREFIYHHPVYSLEVIDAQQKWHTLSGVHHTHFCGAYWFNGFHEDGVRSALRVCDTLEAL